MDSHNLFATRWTYRLMRLEYAVALLGSVLALVIHLGDVRWWVFAGMFVYIDIIGYVPGAVAYRRAKGREIARSFYVLYNLMHSLVTAAVVVGLWCLIVGPEWALIAVPIHLGLDRAVFGNMLKPFGLSFEPTTHPLYKEFAIRYEEQQHCAEQTRDVAYPLTHA